VIVRSTKWIAPARFGCRSCRCSGYRCRFFASNVRVPFSRWSSLAWSAVICPSSDSSFSTSAVGWRICALCRAILASFSRLLASALSLLASASFSSRIQLLNRGERDAFGIDGRNVLVVFAQAKGGAEVLRHRAEVANRGRLLLVVPGGDGKLSQTLQNRARVHRRRVCFDASVADGRP